MLKGIDRLVVRDPASVDRASALGIDEKNLTVGGDLVALNPRVRRVVQESEVITICPSAASRIETSVLCKQVLSGLSQVANKYGWRPKVQVLALSATPTANDEPLAREITDILVENGYETEFLSYSNLGLDPGFSR